MRNDKIIAEMKTITVTVYIVSVSIIRSFLVEKINSFSISFLSFPFLGFYAMYLNHAKH